MNWRDTFLLIGRVIWYHPWRSIVAVLGVVWGTFITAMLLAIGQGMYARHYENLSRLAKPVVYVFLGTTGLPYQGLNSGRHLQLTFNQLKALQKQMPDIVAISPIKQQMVSMKSAYDTVDAPIISATPALFTMFPLNHIYGRAINELDVIKGNKVIFLDYLSREKLFPALHQPLGEKVVINGFVFRVIGYAPEDAGAFSFVWQNAYIPFTSFLHLNQQFLIGAQIELKPGVVLKAFKQKLHEHLAWLLHFSPQDRQAVGIVDLTGLSTTFQQFFVLIRLFLGFCGLMSLIVGGIGVANMMYYIVHERSREIGLHMALGAKPRIVQRLFLWEAIGIVTAGGLLGLIFVYVCLSILTTMPLPEWMGQPFLSLPLVITIVLLVELTGVVAGFFPARQAARLMPVIALKGS